MSGLTLGPCLFNWPEQKWKDFYFRIADEAPIERVIVGEAVCFKRAPFFDKHLPEVIERLESAGKRVGLATLALVMTESERQAITDLCASDFYVEAADMSAVSQLKGRPFSISPAVNIYNEGTAKAFESLGADHICLPGELSMKSVTTIADALDVPVEVFAFGRLPLAISARCYHARAEGLSKDGCLYVCNKEADGMDVDTMDGEPFLAVNGVQTMSHTIMNLLGDVPELQKAGVNWFRLSPHSVDMVKVAEVFKAVMTGMLSPEEGIARLEEAGPMPPFSNGFLHNVEGVHAKGTLAAFGK